MYRLWNDNWHFALKPLGAVPEEGDYRPVKLPHDWLIYDTRDLYRTGDGFYRKVFCVRDGNRIYSLRFDGVYMDSEIYLNGEKIFEWKYGYTAFEVPLKTLREGENELILRVRYQSPNSRWYSGAGIYRDVWLRETGSDYILPDGTYVVSAREGEGWRTEVDTEISCPSGGLVRHTLYGSDGKAAACCEKAVAQGEEKVSQNLEIADPNLWSPDDPRLYTLQTQLVVDGKVVDERSEKIGYREVRFDPDQGFFLNGENLKLKGVCMHHDLGALGAAVNLVATRRQLGLLKEMGVNSIRTSHNPPSAVFMDLCDEMGFLVDSEGFDMWELKKNEYDYHRFFPQWHERDTRSWIRRDRNRPSVILWSIGNEIYDTHASVRGLEITKELIRCVGLDDYKCAHPVTSGSNYMRWEPAQRCAWELGAVGYNYMEDVYDEHHRRHPEWIIYGSETGSTVQSRGIYHFPAQVFATNYDDGQCSSLLNCATGWGAPSPEYNISMDRNRKFSLGQYVWTGFDYIGEPTPYHSKNSFFGHIDTAGFPKDTFYAYKAEWNQTAAPFVHLFPYWDFNEGQLVDVFAFSNCAKTELFVNGVSAGTFEHDHEKGERLSGRWKVSYHRGEIRAVGYDSDGRALCEAVRKSFGDPAKIVLRPDKTRLLADGEDMAFLEVGVEDAAGNPVENARSRMQVEVDGAGRLLGLDNGDSTDYEQYKGFSRRLFSGKLLIMIGAAKEAGEIRVRVTSPGLPETVLKLESVGEGAEVPGSAAEGAKVPESAAKGVKVPEEASISLRKIELSVSSQLICPENAPVSAFIRLLPENTSCTADEICWKAVTDSGVATNLLDISREGLKAVLKPRGDGKYRLRASCRNGTAVEEVISELEMENRGFGPASFDPYSGILCASIASNADTLTSNMEGGVLTDQGVTKVIFERVDFGKIGSDEITIGIYTYNEEKIPVELYCDGRLLETLDFQAKNEWNVYKYNTFRLPEKLKGDHRLEFVFREQLRFKGFCFSRPRRLGEEILATENDLIYGDAYRVGGEMIEHIGNNVTLLFKEIDLKEGACAVEITGRTHSPHDTLHLRFPGREACAVEFAHTEEPVTRRFPIDKVKGITDLQLVFLPGSDFDLQSLRFLEE